MISIIAAMSDNRVIGRGGQLPWRQRDDLQRFKTLTSGRTVIMGRKTWESIGCNPLPNRTNIVISRNENYTARGARVAQELESVVADVECEDEVFIVGGSGIYQAAIPHAQRMYLTIIHTVIEDGDAFFPEFDESEWKVNEDARYDADERNEFGFTFRLLVRR